MTKEKQIKEIFKDLSEIHDEEYEERRIFTIEYTAIRMFDKGYRKASDVAREIFEEIEKIMFCGDMDNKYLVKLMYSNEYDELKKKYTGVWKKRDCSNCKNRNEEGCSFGNMCITSNSPYATPSHWKAKESEDTE